jgi:hypothetical protein
MNRLVTLAATQAPNLINEPARHSCRHTGTKPHQCCRGIAPHTASWSSSPPRSVTRTPAVPTCGRSVGFAAWLEAHGVPSITAVGSIHVAAYVEDLGHRHAAPTVKQHLAAIRMMFD